MSERVDPADVREAAWETKPLGDVAKVSAGGSAPQGDQYFGGPYPFVRVQHLDLGRDRVQRWDLITNEAVKEYRLRLFPAGTIVLPKSGASIRLEKRAILPVDAYIVSHLAAIIPDVGQIHRDFLFYWLRHKRLASEKADGYPTLSLTELKRTAVQCPSLPEQKKISTVLSAVQQAKEKTEAVIAALRELKKSLMKHLFTYGPVRVEEADSVPLRDSEAGRIPEHWGIAQFTDSIVRRRVGTRSVRQRDYKRIGSYPVVDQGQDFIAGYWDDEEDVVDDPLPVIVFGDHTRVFKYVDFPFVVGAQGTKLLFPNTERFVPLFLFHALRSLDISSRGYNRHYKLLRDKKIVVPPLGEQQKTAAVLSAVDARIEAEMGRRHCLDQLFKTFLNDLMTAKIRVKDLDVPVGVEA